MPKPPPPPLTIGVDIGGTHVRLLLVSEDGQVVDRARFPAIPGDPTRVVGPVTTQVNRWRTIYPHILRLGVACAGWVDADGRRIHQSPNLGWHDVRLADLLETLCRLPVQVENDVNAALLGEHAAGAAVGARNCVAVFIGTGVGGGVIADGHLVRGAKGAAAEVGHHVLDPAGPLCTCGRHGCWEAYSGGSGMVNRAKEAIADGEETALTRLDEVTTAEVMAAAAEGDAVAKRIWDEACRRSIQGMANLAVLFDPEIIVVGGGVTATNPALLACIVDGMGQEPPFAGLTDVHLIPAALGDDAAALGVALTTGV